MRVYCEMRETHSLGFRVAPLAVLLAMNCAWRLMGAHGQLSSNSFERPTTSWSSVFVRPHEPSPKWVYTARSCMVF